MKKYAIFGNPVEHSISPIIHNAAFNGLGIEATYEKVLLEDGNDLKSKFYELKLSGSNITVPHKEYAYAACDEIDDFAKKVGAVNTIVKKGNKLYGYNTDAPGFLKTIEEYDNINNVLILGAGGTSKAISVILKEHNYNVHILNRGIERLKKFKKDNFTCFSFDNFPKKPNTYDLIINTTSAGLDNNSLPAPEEILETLIQSSTICIDVIYGKETSFLKLAKKYQKNTKDGLEMLLYQGIIAFMHFTNHKYDFNKIEYYMRQALNEFATQKPSYYSYGERDSLRKTLITTSLTDSKLFGKNSLEIAKQLDKIGLFYIDGSKYSKAKLYLNRALKIRQALNNNISLADSYENLAVLFRIEGQYITSEDFYQKSLQILQKVNDQDNNRIGKLKNQLGVLYKEMGKFKESNKFINEAIENDNKSLYMEAIQYNNIASIKKSEGKYIEAIELYNTALTLQKEFDNTETPHTASIYDNLAYVYKSLGEFKKAIKLYEKALKIRNSTLGEVHEDTSVTYYNLATTYMNINHYDKAEKFFKKALDIREQINTDSSHPKIASLYESIGILSLRQSDNTHSLDKKQELLKKGKEFLLKTLNIREDILGLEHPDTASTYSTLGSYYYKYEGNLDESIQYYLKSLSIKESLFETNIHPDIATNYYLLSISYLSKKNCKEALTYIQKSLDITSQLKYSHPLQHQFTDQNKKISSLIKKAKKLPSKRREKLCTTL